MADERIVVSLDVGTTKVCMIVGVVNAQDQVRVIGLGIEPSRGIVKGTVVDIEQATETIKAVKHQAERTSGYEIGRAFVSVAGKHISSINSRGVTGLNTSSGVVGTDSVERALQAARAVALPHQREVLHVIPRTFIVDGQEGIKNPIGLHAYRLEVEAHIITASSSALRNLEKAINDAGLNVDRFVLNPLASAEVILSEAERDSGIVVIDIGGGTTDIAVFIEGTVWHTAVIEVGGNHITSDIATVLHLPVTEADRIKIDHGNTVPDTVDPAKIVTVQPFGEEMPTRVLAQDLAAIIEARVDEIFTLVVQELRRSGYDGLLSAGVVLTGGTANLKGIRHNAARVMNMPVKVAGPHNLIGLSDKIKNPQYSTSVGLVRFANKISIDPTVDVADEPGRDKEGPDIGKAIGDFIKLLFPD